MSKRKEPQLPEKKEVSLIRSSAAEYLTFVAATGGGGVEAVCADESVWLTQKMMGVLYDVIVRTANEHQRKTFADNEAQEDSVIRKFRITASGGKNCNTLTTSSPPSLLWAADRSRPHNRRRREVTLQPYSDDWFNS